MLAGNYFVHTLGCAKNVADSDGIQAVLELAGLKAAASAEDADVLIVNTCGFLQSSRQESLEALRSFGQIKQDGQLLIASGCLISRYGEAVQREVPQVDGIIDAGKWLAMPSLIRWLQSNEKSQGHWLDDAYLHLPSSQIGLRSVTEYFPRKSQGVSAFLKIADGCDRPCTFCIIPAIKGPHHSKPADDVVSEARELVSKGIQEIVLVAQDTTAYGWDLGIRDQLAPLIHRLCTEVDGLVWLRLMYAYPGHVTPQLIETMARFPQIVHYLDIPLQHAHPDVLRRMKRPNTVVTRRLLDDLRTAMPDIAIRTTFIVGFPGETEDEFEALLEFLEEQRFDRVGVFEYSREGGTGAGAMSGQISQRIKGQRRSKAMQLQQAVSLAKNRALVGQSLQVLVEAPADVEFKSSASLGRAPHFGLNSMRSQPAYIGRSYRDAPEVDGVVIILGDVPPGRLARVRIKDAGEYDLVGEPEHILN